jgi:hypothetical protein
MARAAVPAGWQDLDDQSLVRLGQGVLAQIASLPDCPADQLERLALFGHAGTKVWVASHPHSSPEVIAVALAGGSPYIRDAAVRNPNCPVSILRRLAAAGSQPPYAKIAAARLRLLNCSADQLRDIWQDMTSDVYWRIAAKASPQYLDPREWPPAN